MTEIGQFQTNGYVSLTNIIPTDICNIVTQYALLQEQVNPKKEDKLGQVPNAHSVYSDTLMEVLMSYMKPYMEKYTGLELCPTYSYFRVYRPGMILERHTDRPSCEISTTICFGYNYQDVAADYKWSMYVDPSYRHSMAANFVPQNKPGHFIPQNPGDIIIYKGCEIEHWRDPFVAGEDSWQVQAFFHYINKNGPYYPEYAFDRRNGLGLGSNIHLA
jgi:hypothetical protein